MLDRIAAALARFASTMWQDLAGLFQAGPCPHCGLPVDQGDHDACAPWQADR